METKSDGLPFNEWVIRLLDKAKSCGYGIDTELSARAMLDFYNSDYSAEDAWQEMFDEMYFI